MFLMVSVGSNLELISFLIETAPFWTKFLMKFMGFGINLMRPFLPLSLRAMR